MQNNTYVKFFPSNLSNKDQEKASPYKATQFCRRRNIAHEEVNEKLYYLKFTEKGHI